MTPNPGTPTTPTGQASPEDTSSGVTGSGAVYGEGSHRADADYKAAREAVQQDRATEKTDRSHALSAEIALRDKYGNSFEHARRVISRYIDSLPVAEREELERGELESGTLALNDTGVLEGLMEEAIGPLPIDPQGVAAEIANAEIQMRTNRHAWMRNDKAQLRYQLLLKRRDGA